MSKSINIGTIAVMFLIAMLFGARYANADVYEGTYKSYMNKVTDSMSRIITAEESQAKALWAISHSLKEINKKLK